MKSLLLLGAVLCCGLAAGPASAQTDSSTNQGASTSGMASHSNFGVAGKVSTLGIQIEAAKPILNHANIRLGFNVFGLSDTFDNDGINMAANLNLRSFDVYFDWFPGGGSFHLSPGLVLYNGNEVTATATVPQGRKFSLGNEDLISNNVSGNASVSYERVAPSLLLGWGNLVPRGQRRWSIPVEIGIVYTRAPTASLTLTGTACDFRGQNCRSIAADPQLQSDLKSEQDDMNHDLKDLKIYPVIGVGFSYKF